MSTSVFAILLLLGTSPGYARSSYRNAASGSEKGATMHGYELLADGSIHTGENGSLKGFFVRGQIKGGNLVPRGEVQGKGRLGTTGHPGWIELYDGSFYGDETARPPRPPYVRGYKDPSGKFHPSSRKVVY